jgi:hypothetical protein
MDMGNSDGQAGRSMTENTAEQQPSTGPGLVAAGGVLATLLALAALVVVLLLPADDTSGPVPVRQSPPLGATLGSADSGVLTSTATVVGLDTVEVQEDVVWPEGGPSRLRLSLGVHPVLTGPAAALAPRVENLIVELDSFRVHAAPVPGQSNAWDVASPVSLPPRAMRVTYDLLGVVVRTSPSKQDRAMAVLMPLAAQAAPNESTMTVRGTAIRNVYCPALPREQLMCGDRIGATWEVTLPTAAASPVIAQLDLPDTA